jgi:hypothetical protein
LIRAGDHLAEARDRDGAIWRCDPTDESRETIELRIVSVCPLSHASRDIWLTRRARIAPADAVANYMRRGPEACHKRQRLSKRCR